MPVKNQDGSPYNPVYHPNQALANAIVNAFANNGYKDHLLSDGTKPAMTNAIAADNYGKVRRALLQVGIDIQYPVVLTFAQYTKGYQKVDEEVVFVLPDHFADAGATSLPAAAVAMSVTPLGM